jgi:hypothetical protein
MLVRTVKPRKEKEVSVKFALMDQPTQVEQKRFPVRVQVKISPSAWSKDNCEKSDTIPLAELFVKKPLNN